MFSDGLLSAAAGFDYQRLLGEYALYDDGWPCRLVLKQHGDRLTAEFESYDRTEGLFAAVCAADPVLLHGFRLTVQDFNEVSHQVYRGYAFTRGVVGITGFTEWKGEPYGFFGRRHPPHTIGSPVPGTVVPSDFLGHYHLYCDGLHATVHLSSVEQGAVAVLTGSLCETTAPNALTSGGGGGLELPVRATVDAHVPYRIALVVEGVVVPDTTPPPTMDLLMFSRPRTALAGSMRWGGTELGCYLTKYGRPDHRAANHTR
ncbi:hypothetical protein ACIRU3_38295 [Streptomyces sp. NPDC101151]|uniref:hypothetical protein n=1 Tax=Streptomyces sp. NPDC101151 TaxID=3366115 RepID=UPI0037F755C8